MGDDDLSAFFAKKTQKKSKKKNIVSLEDVGQQLERKVKIQDAGESEFDENIAKEHADNAVKVQQTNEDSEWIECIEKPSIVGINFKELTDNPDDFIEEEKKNANNETNKTWNVLNLDKSEKAIKQVVVKMSTKYQTPGGRRTAPLDLNNQEMFPSIAHADKIAEKLKADEKKKLAAGIKEDQFDQVENKRSVQRDVYRVPNRNADSYNQRTFETPRNGSRPIGYDSSSSINRNGSERSEWTSSNNRRRPLLSDNSDAPSDAEVNWRSAPVSTPAVSSHTYNTPSVRTYNQNNASVNESNVSKAEESGNWRSNIKRTEGAALQSSQTPATANPTASSRKEKSASTELKKYVLPCLRKV